MKKVLFILSVLALAGAAFAQTTSYVGNEYTGANTLRTQDPKLGFHDVLLPGSGPKGIQDYAGCQSCHLPHGANNLGLGTTAAGGFAYIWFNGKPTVTFTQNDPASAGYGTAAIAVNAGASFHTIACLSCHDGVDATNVTASLLPNSGNAVDARIGQTGDLSHEHPVDAILSQHGTTGPTLAYVRLFTPAGTPWTKPGPGTVSGSQFGFVECGSCHDPHKGDTNTYMFLRGPSGAVTPQYARLGLCRDCHSSK